MKIKGKRIRSQHESEQEAAQWEEQKLNELGIQSNQPIATVSLLELATKYLDYADSKFIRKTYNEKKLAFRMLLKSVNPYMDAAELHKGDVLVHLAQQAKQRSGYSANKDRKNLVAAWNWAVEYIPGFFFPNPFLVERFPEVRSNRYVPPEEDFWKVYEAAESEQDALMLLCYLHLAARKSEIFLLKTEDVDLRARRIRLATRKRRDGSQHYDWLPMTDRLYREFFDFLPTVTGEWVFLNSLTELPYASRQRWVPRLCKKAGVKEFGLHGIRHLSASILISNKVSLLDVQTILRHKNLTTTQGYVHRLEDVRSAVKVFK
ncbi:MAG: tyrosine-type recombinase/integrase [Candidatus Electrothrix sp.]